MLQDTCTATLAIVLVRLDQLPASGHPQIDGLVADTQLGRLIMNDKNILVKYLKRARELARKTTENSQKNQRNFMIKDAKK